MTAEEAYNNKIQKEVVDLKSVEATFYFKDNTSLKVRSSSGVYNNKTLDMIFNNNVKAVYSGSELFAEQAKYLNSKSLLIISKNVKVKDVKGTILAEELLFDIKNKKLNIKSSDEKKVNANIKLK